MKAITNMLRTLTSCFRFILAGLLIVSIFVTTPAYAAVGADLTITKTHVGNFTQAETDKTYTITVTNSGDESTTGTVTVVDTLPTGLTATMIDGPGWSCNTGTLTCTRNDALDSGLSYPTIIVTVNVDVDAPALIVNQATVSGGADVDILNNEANDSTTVIQKADLIITNVTLSNPSPDPNEPFSVNVTVKNQGGLDSQSLVYRHVYVDTGNPYNLPPDPGTGCPSTDDPYENYFRSDFNDGMPAGVVDTKAVDIPGLSAGSHELWVFVDATCINDNESIETNNAYGPIEIIIESVPLVSPWVGGVTVESNRNIITVGRPHTGTEVMTYNGFAGGSTTVYVPMLFKNMWTGYNAALYVQNIDAVDVANLTFKFYDVSGNLVCTKNDTLNALSSKGYWMPSETCLPASWYGAVVVTSDKNIVAVGRPHIDGQVTTYNGFSAGSTTMYVPMLFKDAFGGDYDSALYVQNVTTNPANITIRYYNNSGGLDCTKTDTISQLSSKGYWLPTVTCNTGSLPVGWVGGVVVTSDQDIVAVGRPHIGTQVTTYSGFSDGGLSMSVPMLFKGTFGSYDSALYVQNIGPSTANITIKFYDANGDLTCTKQDTVAVLASKGYWIPTITCNTGSLPAGWSGNAVVTSNQNIIAVGRPHLGTEVMTYNGSTSGDLINYIPMLFNNAFGSYNSSFYIQNLDPTNLALVTVKFYDASGNLSCTREDAIHPLASRGYWVPSVTCNP